MRKRKVSIRHESYFSVNSRQSWCEIRDTDGDVALAKQVCHACRRNSGNRRLVAGSCSSVSPSCTYMSVNCGMRWTCSPYTCTRAPGGRVSRSLVLSVAKRRAFCNRLPVCVPRIREGDTVRVCEFDDTWTNSVTSVVKDFWVTCSLFYVNFCEKTCLFASDINTSDANCSLDCWNSLIDVSKFGFEKEIYDQ